MSTSAISEVNWIALYQRCGRKSLVIALTPTRVMPAAGKQVYEQMYFLPSVLASAYCCLWAGSVWAVGLLRKSLVSRFQAEEKESPTVLPYPNRGKKDSWEQCRWPESDWHIVLECRHQLTTLKSEVLSSPHFHWGSHKPLFQDYAS